jgi:hypothetical protein
MNVLHCCQPAVIRVPGEPDTSRRCSGVARSTSRSDQIRPDQIRSDQIRSDQIRPDQTRSDQIRPDQIRSDQIRSDQIRSDQIRSDQIRSDQIRSDQIRSPTNNEHFKTIVSQRHNGSSHFQNNVRNSHCQNQIL